DMPSGDAIVPMGRGEMKRSPESARQYELELQRMIDQLRHFPCIVMWVPFNEGWGQFDTRRITEWIKRYDPTRLVNNASGWNDMGVGDVHDVHVYPGPGAPPVESRRAGVLGEFGGLGLSIKGHLWDERTWSYRGVADSADLTRKYAQLLQRVYQLKEKNGLCAAIYTQITDVEVEANGLLTYDREVIKVDVERVAAANRGDFSRVPRLEILVPTAREQSTTWRYTTEKPAEGWFRPDFDAQGWKQGPGGFGTVGTPGTVVRTEWKSPEIWVRREFELPDVPADRVVLILHHDEDAEVYLNGVLAAQVRGYTTDYEEVVIREEARKALKPGKNVLAIHCRQTGGGQYIDAGLGRWQEPKAK
ncbi:MAG: beta-galactosidase, partial [Gemmataceae bacterium]|nr:beta-galactosidase [Gemmataceae bacterium]